jgi:hypothetical protein
LRLWVEIEDDDDADIFVWLRKLDADGKSLTHIVIPLPELVGKGLRAAAGLKPVRDRMPAAALYGGPWGKQNVALRALNQQRSAEGQPFHPVDISLWPMGMRFRKGEQLTVQIAGFNMRGPNLPGIPLAPNRNRGTTIIHTGPEFDSHLLLPVAP